MEGIQEHSEEILTQKDVENQETVDQIETCQSLFNDKDVETEKINVKMTHRIRDSGQECVVLG